MRDGRTANEPRHQVERLRAGSAGRLRSIRLRALQDSPGAFETTLQDAVGWPTEMWDRQLEQLATFVATASGADIGLVRGSAHNDLADAAYLTSLWVAPESRRQGIGSALVDAVADWARSQGYGLLFLDVVETELPAIALYARQGFAPNGEGSTLPAPRDHIREVRMIRRL